METPENRFRRVLLALEDLVAQEEMLLRAEDFAAVPSLQDRTAPLVEFLVRSAHLADRLLKERIAAVIRRRERNQGLLAQQLDHARDELRTIRMSTRRVAQVAPAYRQPVDSPAVARLVAQG